MGKPLAQSSKPAFDIGNALEEAADAIRERSKKAYAAGKMSLDEYLDARAQELELRSEAALIVAKILSDVIDGASQAGANIELAIAEAKARIEDIEQVKRGLKIVAALVVLAAALSAGDVGAIVGATKEVIKVSKKPKEK